MFFPNRESRAGVSLGVVKFVTWIYVGCAVLRFVEASHQSQDFYAEREDSRVQIPPRAVRQVHFYLSTRYGRSDPLLKVKAARAMKIVPRVDRFFLGSRYGKRSQEDQQVIFFPNYSKNRLSNFDKYASEEDQQEDEPIVNAGRSVEDYEPSIQLRRLVDDSRFGQGFQDRL